MNVLVRKFRSLLSHARTPSQLTPALRRNVALARGLINGRGCFTYDSPLRIRFICFTDNPTSLQLFVRGYQEEAEIEIARAWLHPGDRCIDVGANVGLLSVVFASAVGKDGAVLAIEPSPIAFARLTEALRLLDLNNVVPLACCVSSGEGVTQFFVASSSSADAEEESMRVSEDRRHEFRQVVVPSAQLASLCRDMDGFASPALLKIDVEGAEPLVLTGSDGVIRSEAPPLVIAEIHRTALANYDHSPAEILAHFPSARFDLFFIPRSVSDERGDRLHGRVYPLTDPADLPIYSNLIAIPVGGWEASRGAAVRQVISQLS